MVLPLTARAAEPASAGTWYNQDFKTWYTKVADPTNPSEIFGERYTAAQVQWVIYGLFAFFINQSTDQSIIKACLDGDMIACGKAVKDYMDKLSSTTMSNGNQSLASLVFADRPISGISYVKDKLQKLSTVPTAHAQSESDGFGFSALSGIQDMWKAFRDIAFGLFIIIAIVFSFMIMFRVKLSPQTVVSVQSALPKIIGSLIAVTFSYAIAGFLIDFMYIVIGLLSISIAPIIPMNWVQHVQYIPTDVFNILTVGPITTNPTTHVATAGGISGLLSLYLGPLLTILILVGIILLVIGVVGSPTVALPIISMIGIIIIIIALVIIIWMTLKVVFALLKAFANVILLTIFAPLQLTLGTVIPSMSFGAWVKSYLGALSVFVVTGVLGIFSWIFSIKAWGYIGFGTTGEILISGNIGRSPWPPLLGGSGDVGLAMAFAGVAFVLWTLIPKATEVVQGFISGKPFAYGTAIGEAFGPIKGAWGMAGAPVIEGVRKDAFTSSSNELVKRLSSKVQKIYGGVNPKEGVDDSGA